MPVPSFEEITPEYIERLLQDRVPENFHLDYKEILEDKPQEFAKDISSFANTEGGLILYGIAEEKKITGQSTATPKSPPPGITGLNLDTLGRKYANWLEDCTDPVIRGFRQKVVSVGDKDILAIRIARSISAPHAVHNGGQGVRFWKRREYGAFTPMALEVKSMFLEQDAWINDAEIFRRERIEKLRHGEAGFPARTENSNRGLMLLQVLPLGRTRTVDADISKFFRELLSWKTVLEFNNHVPSILRTNFDGLHYSSESNRIDFHTQIFRNGGVEFFSSFLFHKDTAGDYIIFQDNFSSWIANAGNGAIKFLQTQSQVEPPYIVMLTLIDVDNLPIRHDKLISFTPRGFQQRDLKFTPLVIDEAGDDEVCRVLDQISEFAFQAAGLSGK